MIMWHICLLFLYRSDFQFVLWSVTKFLRQIGSNLISDQNYFACKTNWWEIICFPYLFGTCLRCTPVFYEVCGSAWVSRELPPLYFLSIFSNYKHPPPPCNKTVGLAGLGMDFQSVKWISRAGGSPRAIFPPSTTISAPTHISPTSQHHPCHSREPPPAHPPVVW